MTPIAKGILIGLAIGAVIGGNYRTFLYDTPKQASKQESKLERTVTVSNSELAAVITYAPEVWETYDAQTLTRLAASQLANHAGNLVLGPDLMPYAVQIDTACIDYKLSVLKGESFQDP